jgi:hypothetical protein
MFQVFSEAIHGFGRSKRERSQPIALDPGQLAIGTPAAMLRAAARR